LAAAIDDLFQPAGDEEKPVRVEVAEVAGPEPALAEAGRRRLGIVLVAGHDVDATHDDLPADARGEGMTVGIDDRNLGSRAHADGSGLLPVPARTPADPGLPRPRASGATATRVAVSVWP